MQHVLNKYEKKGDHSILVLESKKYARVDVFIDDTMVEKLSPFTWCYECTRGRIYTTCLNMNLPRHLGYSNCHIPLWKMIAWHHTGNPKVQVLKRKNFDLRVSQMVIWVPDVAA